MANEEDLLEIYWDDLLIANHRAPVPPQPPTVGSDPGDLVIGTSCNRILAVIKVNGEISFGPEYTPTEAARVFWEAMATQRLLVEDRLLVIQHMEAILVRLGRADMECERLRRAALEEGDPVARAAREQEAERSMRALELVANQAIELGRGLVRRPEVTAPPVPNVVPESLRQNPDSDYSGNEGLPPESDPEP